MSRRYLTIHPRQIFWILIALSPAELTTDQSLGFFVFACFPQKDKFFKAGDPHLSVDVLFLHELHSILLSIINYFDENGFTY
jgi:hypothetical protein